MILFPNWKEFARTAMREKIDYLLEDFRSVEMFASVVETSSLARTAHRLGVTSSTVSKKLTELESRAKARLLNRTTRRVTVTEAGKVLYRHCLTLLEQIERAEQSVRDHTTREVGRIRVAAPVVFGERHISPLLPEFLRTHQRVELELLLSARTVNFVEEGFDLSIRIIRGKHAGRNGQILAPNRRIFCASPGYLKAHGAPNHPRELANHSCLIATVMQKTDLWRYQDKGKIDEVRVSGPLISDNISILADSAAKGLGIVMIGSFAAERDLKRGRLVEVLRGFTVPDSYFAMYVPNSTLTPQRVRTFMDYLQAKVGQPPLWDRAP